MKDDFAVIGIAGFILFFIGYAIGMVSVSQDIYTECLEKGIAVETCKELRT